MRRVRTREQASEAGKPKNHKPVFHSGWQKDGEPEDGFFNADPVSDIKLLLSFGKRYCKTASNFSLHLFFNSLRKLNVA